MTTFTLSIPEWIAAAVVIVGAANAVVKFRLSVWSKRLAERQSEKIAELKADLRSCRIALAEYGIYTMDEVEKRTRK